MGIPNNLEFIARLKAMSCISQHTQFVITHFSHHYAPFQTDLEAMPPSSQWSAAFDGMSVQVYLKGKDAPFMIVTAAEFKTNFGKYLGV